MTVRSEDFDLEKDPVVGLSAGSDIVVAGTHQRSVDESKFLEHRGSSCWGNTHMTLKGAASCALSPDSLSLSFRKAEMASADEMRRLMQEMSEAITEDPDRYEQLSAQLEALMNPDDGDGSTRLTGIVQYFLECPMGADYRSVKRNKCESDSVVKTSEQGTHLEKGGFALTDDFEATYIKSENGEDRIEATFSKTTPGLPSAGNPYDCPPMTGTFTFRLSLTREQAD